MSEFDLHSELREVQRRLSILRVVLLLFLFLLGARLWHLQIYEGGYYRNLSDNNRTRTVLIEPARGLMYDRHGELLANNVPSFTLYVTLEDVKDREQLIQGLINLIGLDEEVVRKKLSARGSKLLPRKVKDGLTLKEAALIESHRLDFPGVMIQAELQRNYPAGLAAGHMTGYVGEVSSDQLERENSSDLHQGSIVGQYGLERTYDRLLRGRPGQKVIEVDATGHVKRTVLIEKSQSGDDLYMTIDIRLQKLAESLLGEEAGAIVALDPTTGEVLAMASRPGFDPNILSRELTAKQWEEVVQDERRPLTNRATQGQYPPGSTFKIVMAAAALETDTVQPSSQIRCVGGYQFGKRVFRDWKAGGHGMIDLKHAIIHSCDVYFYTVGNRMGIDTIAAYAGQFGLGKETGIELPSERAGIMPSTTWKQRVRHEQWFPGETISAAIGQGYVTVTPLQMARLVGIVANNGVSYKPRLVRTIMHRESGHMDDSVPDLQGRLTVDRRTLELIQEGLSGVVTEGTATKAKSPLITIAGKTGTAQTAALRTGPQEDIPKKLRDHAWFVAYAPVESPRIAVAVLVEHMGHGGSTAAPLAKQLIEEFVKLRSLDPVPADPEHPTSNSAGGVSRRGTL